MTIHPIGKILNPHFPRKAYELREEEVPRIGVNVSRVIRRTRWIDGSTHLWIGRNIQTGQGGARSNLRFDKIEINPDPDPAPPLIRPENTFVLDSFSAIQSVSIHECRNPADVSDLSLPYILSGAVALNRCWVDVIQDPNFISITGSRTIVPFRRQIELRHNSRTETENTSRIHFLPAEDGSFDIELKSEANVSLFSLMIKYGLAGPEFFDLTHFSGIRVIFKRNTETIYLSLTVWDSSNERWILTTEPVRNRKWTLLNGSIEVTSSTFNSIEIPFMHLRLAANTQLIFSSRVLNGLSALSILVQSKFGGNNVLIDRLELY